jgi:multidrug resistance efflux pump
MNVSKARAYEIFALMVAAVWLALSFLQFSDAQQSNLVTAGQVVGADRVMSLGVAVSGIVGQVTAREGERVRATQSLAKLDCRPLEADLRGREAQLRAAQATFDRYRDGSRLDEITVGEAAVRYATARADEAEKALERADAMQEGVTITTARLLEIKRDARIASAQLQEAHAKLSLLRDGFREEDIRQAEALRDVAKAQVEAGRARLDQCTVRAPVDGVVLDVLGNPGEFVSTAVPHTLFHLLADGPLRVRTEVSLRNLADICLSQRAHVVADASPDMDVQAEVTFISPSVTSATSPAGPNAHDAAVVSVLLDLEQKVSSLPIGSAVKVRFDPCTPRPDDVALDTGRRGF